MNRKLQYLRKKKRKNKKSVHITACLTLTVLILVGSCGIPETTTLLSAPTVSYSTDIEQSYLSFSGPSDSDERAKIQGYVIHYRFYDTDTNGGNLLKDHISKTLNPTYYAGLTDASLEPGPSSTLKATAGYQYELVPQIEGDSDLDGYDTRTYFLTESEVSSSTVYIVPSPVSSPDNIYIRIGSSASADYAIALRGVKDKHIASTVNESNYQYLSFENSDYYWDSYYGDADLSNLILEPKPNELYLAMVVYAVGFDSGSISTVLYSMPTHIGYMKINVSVSDSPRSYLP